MHKTLPQYDDIEVYAALSKKQAIQLSDLFRDPDNNRKLANIRKNKDTNQVLNLLNTSYLIRLYQNITQEYTCQVKLMTYDWKSITQPDYSFKIDEHELVR